MTDDRRTFVERLDAAKNGKEFGAVLNDLFAHLDNTRDQEDTNE
jgi:hypothetical protein